MIQRQQLYNEQLEAVCAAVEAIGLSGARIREVQTALSAQEIVVPVVGEFSAGKSSLLNSFLGTDCAILPTAITPETALATELRYDTTERIEAVDRQGAVQATYDIHDFARVTASADRYAYLRLYVHNERIRNISPLILVDMPGFESPLDAHNEAIRTYLNRGAYFIVLVSATDGTLKNTSFRHLGDIQEYERDFSLVISKANLVPAGSAQLVAQKVAEDVDLNLGVEKTPLIVGQDGADAVQQIVAQLDPDRLFAAMVLPDLKNLAQQLASSVEIKRAAFNKNTTENDAVVAQLKTSLAKIEAEKRTLQENARSNLVETNVQAIVGAVGTDLSNAVETLVECAVQGGGEALSAEITDIVHSSLVTNVKTGVRNISDSITSRFSVELSDLGKEMEDYLGSDDFVQKITDGATELYNKSIGTLASRVEERNEKALEDASGTYSALTSILAITTDVIAPVFEVLIVFLPTVLSFFTRRTREAQQREQIRSHLLTAVIPGVKRKLAAEIPLVLEEQVEGMIAEISEHYATIVAEKEREIEEAESERRQRAAEIEQMMDALQTAKKAVATFMQQIEEE